jgi:predicted secreted hydrolase
VAWTVQGADGRDHLSAGGSPGEIELDLTTDRPPVLHDDDGWVDLGPAGGTYYYSRTRMDVVGTFAAPGGEPIAVRGLAWFDHQWGDFIAVGAGGWDWFSVQLDDGRDLTISLVHGPGGVEVLDYGTLVAADGSARHLRGDDFKVSVLGRWLSPHSGADYPAGWRIELPSENLTLELAATLEDQELDTKATTGVTYWEGEVTATGTSRDGGPLAGRGYVELTGYAK